MAARNTTITCPDDIPTKVSDGAVANARVVGTKRFTLIGTAADVAPVSQSGGLPMLPHSVLTADISLADLFPGVTGPYYLWVWPDSGSVNISISHA